MKIRKVFESYEYSSESYKKILSWHGKADLRHIDRLERDKLIEVFVPLLKKSKMKQGLPPKRPYGTLTCGSSTNRVDIDILTDNDEWYYARIVYSSGSLPSGSSGFNHYFKCDQLDGLISCIENEVINKIGR